MSHILSRIFKKPLGTKGGTAYAYPRPSEQCKKQAAGWGEGAGEVLTWALEHDYEGVALVLRLQRDRVLVARALENLGDVGSGQAQGEAAIAAVVVEAIAADQQLAERDMARVHRLHGDPGL